MFHLPHRRRRCWMWAVRQQRNTICSTLAVKDILPRLQRLPTPCLDAVLLPTTTTVRKRGLNAREEEVLASALKKAKGALDVVVDVAKSVQRGPYCVGAVPCLVPNSQPYVVAQQRFLDGVDFM
eukprot:500264-Amphidinium_carterae.1